MSMHCNRKPEQYRVFIVDMDGTLYYKRPMQIKMALQLLGYYCIHLFRLPELFMLYDYRKLRDQDALSDQEGFEQIIVRKLSQKYRFSEEKARQVIDQWILTRPLKILYDCRDRQLISFLDKQRSNGKKVLIYSDYPAENKCKALGIQVDGIYWPDGESITVLKPSAQGLNHIIHSNQLDRQQILFIGDRQEKDGACARSANVDCFILKKHRSARRAQYKRLMEQEP